MGSRVFQAVCCWVYFFFFCFGSVCGSSPLNRLRREVTSSRSMLISLSSAAVFASAIFLSSSISSSRFFRSVSSVLIFSTVFLKLLIEFPFVGFCICRF
jgi:hypothetical protein